MEAPPPFIPPAAPKKKNTVLIVVLILLGLIVLCCGGLIFTGFYGLKKMRGFLSCTIHYQSAYRAFKKYAAVHGGKLPDGKKWQEDIAAFYMNQKDRDSAKFIADAGDPNGDLGCAADASGPATGMAFNKDLAGKKMADVSGMILLFEVPNTGRDLSMPYKVQPGEPPQKLFGKPRPWLYIDASGHTPGSQGAFSADLGDNTSSKQ